MVHLDDPQAGVRVAVGEGVEPGAEDDQLVDPDRDRVGQDLLGEPAAGAHEPPHPVVAALPGASHEVVRVVTRHPHREWVVQDRAALEELVDGAVPGGAERRTTGRAVDVHGAILADVETSPRARLC